MIEYLRGTLLSKSVDGHLVIDVNGVGYGVDVPLPASHQLPAAGETVQLFIHFHVTMTQGATGFSLYGFPTIEEKDLFEVLLTAQGIGPGKAIDILSSSHPAELVRMLLQGDLARLSKLRGIGKKTAEKLVVHLRDKMKLFAQSFQTRNTSAEAADGGEGSDGQTYASGSFPDSDNFRDAVEALESLQVKPLVAERAILKAIEVLGTEASVAELVKEGLKHRR